MSALNRLMVRWIGPNWKTTISGIANALLSVATSCGMAAAMVSTEHRVLLAVLAAITGALSGIAKAFQALVSADAPTPPTIIGGTQIPTETREP